ncbi:hypothetical protein OF001_U400011 [Pseudomonas sp. OF001]|nr:hypothetical protein OF001_U400011 [Pseudomonas sp. OF001]
MDDPLKREYYSHNSTAIWLTQTLPCNRDNASKAWTGNGVLQAQWFDG